MTTNSIPLEIMKFTCIVSGAFGLLSVAASHPAFEAPWAWVFDAIRWPLDGRQGQFSSEARVLNAVLGGVLAGWSALLYWLVQGPIPDNMPGAKRAFIVSVLVWFALDTTGSLASGWWENAVLNLLLLTGLLLPMIVMDSRFRHSTGPS
jgi:hypothetical protein